MDWVGTIRAVHQRIASGDMTSFTAVAAEADATVDRLIDAADLLSTARTSPNWVGTAVQFFSVRSWGAVGLCQVAHQRLNRWSLVLEYVTGSHAQALSSIEILLAKAESIDAEARANGTELPGVVTGAWTAVARSVEDGLSEAYGNARSMLTAETFTDQQREWLANGATDSMQALLDGPNQQGPRIPDLFANGEGGRDWVPQGLTHDPGTGYTFQTSYDGKNALLSVVDPETGKVVTSVELGGDPPPDHAGGVSVHDGTVWVSSSGKPAKVVPYDLGSLLGAPAHTQVAPSGPASQVGGGAYHTISGGTLYAGTFNEEGTGEMWTYEWDAGKGSWAQSGGPFTTPQETQGIAVQGDQVVFSTSWGRDNQGSLQSYSLSDVLGTDGSGGLGDPSHQVDMPNMLEGIALGPDGLLATYESGADKYSDKANWWNDRDDLWASTHMTVTPFSALGLTGAPDEVQIDPPSIREAAKMIRRAESKIDKARMAVLDLYVPGHRLGEVDGADEAARALNTHADATGDWIRSAGTSAEACSDAADSTVDFFEESEDLIQTAFKRGADLLGLRDRLG